MGILKLNSAGDDFFNSNLTGDNLLGSTGDNLPESTGDDSPNFTRETFSDCAGETFQTSLGIFYTPSGMIRLFSADDR